MTDAFAVESDSSRERNVGAHPTRPFIPKEISAPPPNTASSVRVLRIRRATPASCRIVSYRASAPSRSGGAGRGRGGGLCGRARGAGEHERGEAKEDARGAPAIEVLQGAGEEDAEHSADREPHHEDAHREGAPASREIVRA